MVKTLFDRRNFIIMSSPLEAYQAALEQAQAKAVLNPEEAVVEYGKLVQTQTTDDEEAIKLKETAIVDLANLLVRLKKSTDMAQLIRVVRPFLGQVSKAKAAKLVRQLVDMFLDMEASTGIEVSLCIECVDWAKEEKRFYLQQALEARLTNLYYDVGRYQDALQLASSLLRELKKLDDKQLLAEVHLLESKVYSSLGNLPKARAGLTAARMAANAIYTPPKMQATLDLQSGILHAADENDFKTAYSYFYEAFEAFDSVGSNKALLALKYMLLSKIMLHHASDVAGIVQGKLALKYRGVDIDAMKAVAEAADKRSLADFKKAIEKFGPQLVNDPVIHAHLDTLYNDMLEQNLIKLIEPYSRVQVQHLATQINLPLDIVEKKLSQLILDKKISCILDQGEGVLIVFTEPPEDKTYGSAIDIVSELGRVIDQLYGKAKRLS